MEAIKIILRDLKEDDSIIVSKDDGYDEKALKKLKAYDIIAKEKPYRYDLTQKGFMYIDGLLNWTGSFEDFPFKGENASNNFYFNGSQVAQFNNQSHNNTAKQVNHALIMESFEKALTPEQLKEIKEILEKPGTSESRSKKVVSKIMDYGGQVAVNALSNLLLTQGII